MARYRLSLRADGSDAGYRLADSSLRAELLTRGRQGLVVHATAAADGSELVLVYLRGESGAVELGRLERSSAADAYRWTAPI